jgi:hypothetical protein
VVFVSSIWAFIRRVGASETSAMTVRPEGTCNTVTAVLLRAFATFDTVHNVHAENHTVMPRSVAYEVQVRNAEIISIPLVAFFGLACCNRSAMRSAPATSVQYAAVPGVNVVQSEMRLLDEAMRDSVTAIAFGRLDEIPASLRRVHAARERTDEALENGRYRLPKNVERLETFRALDEAFHDQLEKLVVTARTSDAEATATQLGVVIGKCNSCHVQFRP